VHTLNWTRKTKKKKKQQACPQMTDTKANLSLFYRQKKKNNTGRGMSYILFDLARDTQVLKQVKKSSDEWRE
jgi:hypothetical protein